MTTIGDLLGSNADRLAQDSLQVGDVHIIPMNQENGITPKDGERYRDKFFIILGFDNLGNVIGGVVFNSRINEHIRSELAILHIPVYASDYEFLSHDSYINCQSLKIADRTKFNRSTYRGTISDKNVLSQIVSTLKSSPTMRKSMLKRFGIQ